MYCTNCGAEIPDGKNFCTECGRPIKPGRATQPDATAQPSEHDSRAQRRVKPRSPRAAIICGLVVAAVAGTGALYMLYNGQSNRDVPSAQQGSGSSERDASRTQGGSSESSEDLKTDNDSVAESLPQAAPLESTPDINDSSIMGAATTSVEQMVRRYGEAGHPFPVDVYQQYGAASIQDFCQTLLEEAESEGVRAEVVFAQAMIETGWLQFGGDVAAEQCNFGGLGASGEVSGASFNAYGSDSVRMGLRAQVQHLKAYASTDELNNECVDPRFSLVERGIAPSVYDLAGRWAADTEMGTKIMEQVELLLTA